MNCGKVKIGDFLTKIPYFGKIVSKIMQDLNVVLAKNGRIPLCPRKKRTIRRYIFPKTTHFPLSTSYCLLPTNS